MSSKKTENQGVDTIIGGRREFMKRTLLAATVISLPGALSACAGGTLDDSGTSSNTATFAVISDPHLYDINTLGDSAELDAYLAQDRKMLKDSVQIFNSAISDISTRNIDFMLISGDLTKDGELVDHQLMINKLTALGKPVYVIPGNHDINNPNAKNYTTTPATAASYVTPDQFRSLYANFGYGSALYTDPDSLSYVAEPVSGVWLLAIDSCKYSNNISLGSPVTSGAISSATLTWIQARLADAKSNGKIVIGMMHHGLIEHFTGQSTLFPEYLVDSRETVAAALAAAGLGVMFTGHFHANDVVGKTYSGNTIYDAETGSTVTAPSPYRLVTLTKSTRTLAISTSVVTATTSHPSDFQSYAKTYLTEGLDTLVTELLETDYGLTSAQVTALLPLIVPAMVAHYAGDEKLTDATTLATLQAMLASSDAATRMIGGVVLSLWNDAAPADNNLSLTLPS